MIYYIALLLTAVVIFIALMVWIASSYSTTDYDNDVVYYDSTNASLIERLLL